MRKHPLVVKVAMIAIKAAIKIGAAQLAVQIPSASLEVLDSMTDSLLTDTLAIAYEEEAADSGASLEQASTMPWFPTHETVCNGSRLCRPGEGNLKGYKFWGQPYIHREDYVQSRLRTAPTGDYARLCTIARRVHKDGLVLVGGVAASNGPQ